MRGSMKRRYSFVKKSSGCSPCEWCCPGSEALPAVSEEYFLPQCKIRIDAQGVTIKAIAREKNIAALEPMGIGRIYGPIRPPTKAIGSTAAITANVARMVGLPTSLTASTAMADQFRPLFC